MIEFKLFKLGISTSVVVMSIFYYIAFYQKGNDKSSKAITIIGYYCSLLIAKIPFFNDSTKYF